ncbi:MAG: response regulator transcription factor, partial [Pseudomonadota bacterium]
QGLQLALQGNWDLIILDLNLPGVDGLEICRQVRRNCPYQPILMLTAKSTELDRVLGLETGADDYLAKPFSVLELVARVRAVFRRADNIVAPVDASATDVLQVGALTLDPARREVVLEDKVIDLTAREFDLLEYFARHPGRVFRRSDLLDAVWGYGHEGYEHTVNSHINRLRAKVEPNPSQPALIVTVWGVGYRLEAPRPMVVAV